MNAPALNDIARWQAAEEGQFFERKSAWDRSGPRPKPRKAADIARDIAETLCAMANADGGELVVGIEDGGTATGVALADDKLRLLLGVPKDRNYVSPPLPCQATTGCRAGRHGLSPFRGGLEPECAFAFRQQVSVARA
jgi:ATP-dependent DNA helicase RecG